MDDEARHCNSDDGRPALQVAIRVHLVMELRSSNCSGKKQVTCITHTVAVARIKREKERGRKKEREKERR